MLYIINLKSMAMAPSISLPLLSWMLIIFFTPSETGARHPTSFNAIDGCWRTDPDWAAGRQKLADCAIGYGAQAQGGRNGAIYLVTDPSDDPENPQMGTLRYGVIQTEPLWIIFENDMDITLKSELLVNSYKTIDGRGAQVRIGHGPCMRIKRASHVIVHGLTIEHCKRGKLGRYMSEGDGITIFESNNIWIDHCRVSRCGDGLIDVTHASTFVTISNTLFFNHRKVMLLGHSDRFSSDQNMKVTLVFNYFGHRLVSRMPRARFGYFHVANNRYEEWLIYAIGGSKHPTILSEGNYFDAPDNPQAKQVTWRKVNGDPDVKKWSWTSKNDAFLNGAYFNQSGQPWMPSYSQAQAFVVAPADLVVELTRDAGPLRCDLTKPCSSNQFNAARLNHV